MLEVKDLKYSYNKDYQALKGVSLKVEKGEMVALLGKNGAGKSTLFLHLNGIYEPDYGLNVRVLARIHKIRNVVFLENHVQNSVVVVGFVADYRDIGVKITLVNNQVLNLPCYVLALVVSVGSLINADIFRRFGIWRFGLAVAEGERLESFKLVVIKARAFIKLYRRFDVNKILICDGFKALVGIVTYYSLKEYYAPCRGRREGRYSSATQSRRSCRKSEQPR